MYFISKYDYLTDVSYNILMWQETETGLYRKFIFSDFSEAFAFMTKVAAIAENMQHHPRWTNEWATLEIWLSTHDMRDTITDKDRALAAAIDGIKL